MGMLGHVARTASASEHSHDELGDPLKRTSLYTGRFALTTVAAAALWLAVPDAWALGLGRLNVQSALGESLRAEIDVTSLTPEESANLRISIAPPESYRAAGVDYNAVLPSTKAQILRRPDGRPYVRLTSDGAVQEPFVDVILEISWSTGRLVREYTLLFDPPARNLAEAPNLATEPVFTAPAAPVGPPPLAGVAPEPEPISPAVPRFGEPKPAAPRAVQPKPATPRTAESKPAAPRTAESRPAARAGEPKPSAPRTAERQPAAPRTAVTSRTAEAQGGVDDYRVRSGDTLSRIAARIGREGISLDQMLVSLYRGNNHAFIGNNMNRLKAGVVLAVPSAEQARAVGAAEAREIIQAQSADFGAYRQRLAATVPEAAAQGSARAAGGKVEATVEDRKQAAAPSPDKLTLSKGALADKSAGAEEKIAKEREKNDADTRVAELSRNVEELKRLAGAASAPAATAPAPAASSAVPSVEVKAPVSMPTVPAMPETVGTSASSPGVPIAASATSAEGATVAEASPVSASAATSPAMASPRASMPPPRPAVASAEERGMLAVMFEDNPFAIGGAAAIMAALAGFGIFRFSRRSKKDSGETSFLESRLQPDSFFGASGGQRIDTRDAGGASSSMSYSLSQLDAIGDVDPVAEADVYLAYGRDLQAEEILKEAMRSSPERLAIRTKLLEVYAKRRDTKGFELLATQLYSLTRGEGEDWAKAQEMGQQIDPENELYQPGGAPPLPAGDAAPHGEPLGATTMPQSVLPSPSRFERAKAEVDERLPQPHAEGADSGSADLDLDLSLYTPSLQPPTSGTVPPSIAKSPARQSEVRHSDGLLQFDSEPVAQATPAPAATSSGPSSDFAMDFDLSAISLDLNAPGQAAAAPLVEEADLSSIDLGLDGDENNGDPLARKLELAEEFRQIGDMEGARDLLQEVIAKANGALKSKAQGMLNSLA